MSDQPPAVDSLLRTKHRIPRLRPQIVVRQRLLDRLQSGIWCRLALVCAQAGFGKTTLLVDWARQSGRPVAWITLDEGDNAPERFLRYLHAAIQAALPGVGAAAAAMLQKPQPLNSLGTSAGGFPEAFVSSLINDLDEQGTPAVLVLDDYHTLHNQVIHETVNYLLEHLPQNLLLVIASRSDPPLPLARLRAQGEIVELRGSDLRFTPQESAEFLNRVMGLNLTAEAVAILESRTEGWIAGLQLAGLSMRDRADSLQFIKSLSGSSRFILDYLVEEVLRRQPADIQEFLLKTSILERLRPDLCQAVSGHPGSRAVLERLEQANLFIQALDDEGGWYRYHTLFADLLRYQLKQTLPEQFEQLHLKAAAWYASNQLPVEAVSHFLAAGALPQAALLVEQTAEELLNRGQANRLLGWMDTLPQSVYHSRPRLPLLYVWGLISTSQFSLVEPHFQVVEAALQTWRPAETGSDARNLPEAIAVQLLATRAIVASTQGDLERTIQLSNQALAGLPPDVGLYGALHMGLGVAYHLSGNLQLASRSFAAASEASHKSGEIAVALTALFNVGDIQYECGLLHQAETTYRRGLDLAAAFSHDNLPVTGMAFCGLAGLYYEWDNLPAAMEFSQQAVELCGQWGNTNIQAASYGINGRILFTLGQREPASQALDRARDLAQKGGVTPNIHQLLAVYQLESWLLQDELELAWRWIQAHPFDIHGTISYGDQFECLGRAWVMAARGRILKDPSLLESAYGLLLRLADNYQASGALDPAIHGLALQALCLVGLRRDAEALSVLQQALSLAQPEGYIRLFVDHGPAMAELLKTFSLAPAAPSVLKQYALELLGHFAVVSPAVGPAPRPEANRLPEPLSERELEVLRLVAAGLSNQDIAARLTLASGTVKRHLHNIFGKLDVTTRSQAIARARSLQLV
jgi:LuxR family transcriptional regulator, maltose regulon positive regulatory protein